MRKLIIIIIVVAGAFCFSVSSNASAPLCGQAMHNINLLQDTNPRPRKDSPFEKKKRQDSTRLPKTDTLQRH